MCAWGTSEAATLQFRQGTNGYTGTSDTYIRADLPTSHFSDSTFVLANNHLPIAHALIRFDNLFGFGPGQVPPDATISSAALAASYGSIVCSCPGRRRTIGTSFRRAVRDCRQIMWRWLQHPILHSPLPFPCRGWMRSMSRPLCRVGSPAHSQTTAGELPTMSRMDGNLTHHNTPPSASAQCSRSHSPHHHTPSKLLGIQEA